MCGRISVRGGLRERHTHFDMSTRYAALHQRAHGILKRIYSRRSVDLQVQTAVIQTLDSNYQFAIAERSAHAGCSVHGQRLVGASRITYWFRFQKNRSHATTYSG